MTDFSEWDEGNRQDVSLSGLGIGSSYDTSGIDEHHEIPVLGAFALESIGWWLRPSPRYGFAVLGYWIVI